MSVGPKKRFQVLMRDNFRCRYCGASGRSTRLHVDHIQAKTWGGSDDMSNLVTACIDCNIGKGAIWISSINPQPIPSEKWPFDIVDPVFFKNKQWAVSGYGIECLECPYEIPAIEVLHVGSGKPDRYEWPVHLAHTSWVNTDAFLEAFVRAMEIFDLRIDRSVMAETMREVHRMEGEKRAWHLRSRIFERAESDEPEDEEIL